MDTGRLSDRDPPADRAATEEVAKTPGVSSSWLLKLLRLSPSGCSSDVREGVDLFEGIA